MNIDQTATWLQNEAARCLLCHDAPCSRACTRNMAPDKKVRSLRFATVPAFALGDSCEGCNTPCEEACLHPDFPLRIQAMLVGAAGIASAAKHADISMEFCGVACKNPFFLGSSVIASNYEMCANAFETGWGGLVYKTICTMPLQEVSPRFDSIGKEGTPFIGFRNLEQLSDKPLHRDLETLARLKQDFPRNVVVASIMGRDESEWSELATLATKAGVDIIECNFSCPNMKDSSLGSAVGCDPSLVEAFVAATRRGTHLPVLAKMTPNVTDMVPPALAAIRGGASGISAINTIKSLTGILEGSRLVSGKTAVSGYSGKAVKPIALRFVADMKNCPTLRDVPLCGIGGIENWYDAAEFFSLGCETVQIATAVMQYGYRIIEDLCNGLAHFLTHQNYGSLREFVGSRLAVQIPAESLDRASATYPVINREKCLGCGRCYISCRDGGHQAIAINGRIVSVNGKKCVGCQLCSLVCPVGAIGRSRRVAISTKKQV